MRQNEQTHQLAIHEIKKIIENHPFFNSVFKWNCIWVTSEKFGSGWGSGLQSLLNRPTKCLEPASNRRSSRNHKSVCRDQLVHIRPPAPAPRKKWCFGGNLQIFHFCTLEMGTFPKHVQKPNLSVFEPTWQKRGLTGFMTVVFSFYFGVIKIV